MTSVAELGRRAKAASRLLAGASTTAKNGALLTAADLLLERAAEIQAANLADVEAAAAGGMASGPLDRLRLSDARLQGMADGLRTVAALPDPVGEVLDGWVRPNGLEITRVRVPLGVVAIIYENRPNVTSDAAGLCVKSGNVALLRGSSSALQSNIAVVGALRDALAKFDLPEDCVLLVEDTAHETAIEVMQLTESVDCLIPRGGPALDSQRPRERDGTGGDRRRRQLPRLRRRGRRPRRSHDDRRQRQDAALQRVQRGRVARRARSGRERLRPAHRRGTHGPRRRTRRRRRRPRAGTCADRPGDRRRLRRPSSPRSR